MVGVFRRSLSFPNKPPAAAARQPKPALSRHLRSISLPCRSHPLISSLKDQVGTLKSWSSSAADHRTSAWLCRGLAALKLLHDYLDDILQLPQSRESMCRLSSTSTAWVENLLEDFLRFIDAYGIFQNLILALREDHVAAHVAIRRKDPTRLQLYSKARKRMAKETGKLVPKMAETAVSDSDDELAAAIGDVMEVTGLVSAAVFKGIATSWGRRRGWNIGKKKKKKNLEEEGILEFVEVRKKEEDLEKMKDLEECIGCIESGTDKVFRSLINTRVSILNALSY